MPDRSFTISATRDFPYYRKVWKKVVVILIASAFLPLAVIGGGMYFYMARTIKTKTMQMLEAEVMSHKTDIDSFLTERIRNLKIIAENNSLSKMQSPGAVEQVLNLLQMQLCCFQDLGVIGPTGDHLAYIGPYDLTAKNYRDALWFKSVMASGVYVSDVFTGFRNEPHFIIAVRRTEGQKTWILRATVMSGLFDDIVTRVAGNRKGDAYLISNTGSFQTTPRQGGALMTPSPVSVPVRFTGVRVEKKGAMVQLTTWLDTVPWLSVVSIDKQDIFQDSRKVRNVILFVSLLGVIVIVLGILLTTDSLVSMLEEKRKSNRHMDNRLRRMAFLAASMEVSKGVFSDLNDILSNIHVTATLVKDAAGASDDGRPDILADQIFSEAIRGRNLIDSFARFAGPEDPVVINLDIHRVLNPIMAFLKTALIGKNIGIILDFEQGLPSVRSDGAALRQVFLSLLLNAVAVSERDGSILVSTQAKNNVVMILIADDGPGLSRLEKERLFDPQYSTQRGDSGFTLSICQGIMDRIGGRLAVNNRQEQGAVFEVQVPEKFDQGQVS